MNQEEKKLGCKAYELDPGTEFSFDGGVSWVVCVTIVDDPADDSQDVIINYRKDDGLVDTLKTDSYTNVLLERGWKGYGK